jgi:adenine-specific DNA-methyltransferase
MISGTIDTIRIRATKELNQSKRAELGQFLTPSIIAKFMAELFQKHCNSQIRLLDAGAGVGSLSAAFLDRMLNGWNHSQDIHVTAYEIDGILLPYLKKNLSTYKNSLSKENIALKDNLLNCDFIADAVLKIKNNSPRVFTHAILNPPYKKINSTSQHRSLLSSIGFETVNLYTAFVALSLMLLKDKGELVAIIPRSFCNGNYYKSFRNLITQNAAIKHIHLFEARNQAFKEDDVLQENIILHLVKGENQGEVIISRSTNESLADFTESSYLYGQIVKPEDSEAFIHIPNLKENRLENSDAITYTLSDLGIEVSTGPVVDFRVKEHLFMEPQKGSIPLLYPNHFNGKELDWPKQSKKPNSIALNPETQKMFYPSGFYTLVRRFSSKEEKQRVVARVVNPEMLKSKFIGIENHLNVFHSAKKGISEDLAYGIAAYLNSSFVDIHFRSFSGHTQVNATDLRQMKYPSKNELSKLGKWAKKLKTFEQIKIDEQLMKIL